MKKVNAYQINPAYQQNDIFSEEFERIFIDGGRNSIGIKIDELNEIVNDWEACVSIIENCDTIDEIKTEIDYWMDIQDEEKVLNLRKLADDWGSREYEIDKCCLLDVIYGGDWDYAEIHGCCQGDYAIVYYDKSYWNNNSGIIEEIEIRYFNLGSEWRIEDDEDEIPIYCLSWNEDDIKNEIADAFGYDVDEIAFHKWSGEKRIDVYEEI